MNKDEKRSIIGIISLFVASLGTDSDAKPLAEPLAAGSRDDSTDVSDPKPKDIAPAGNKNESEANQIPEGKKYHGSCPLP